MALLDPPDIVGQVEIEPIFPGGPFVELWFPILGNDPQRLFFVLVNTQAGGILRVWPAATGTDTGITAPAGQEHILVHYASFPGLCQGPWYASVGGLPELVTGYAVRRH